MWLRVAGLLVVVVVVINQAADEGFSKRQAASGWPYNFRDHWAARTRAMIRVQQVGEPQLASNDRAWLVLRLIAASLKGHQEAAFVDHLGPNRAVNWKCLSSLACVLLRRR